MRLFLILMSLAVGQFVGMQATAATETADAVRLNKLFERSTLTIATPDARLHKFRIWVADNDARRSLGLMHVTAMEDDAGMLFVYERPQPIAMWMKNTILSLDMLFVAADGRVTNVVANTTPQSLQTIESSEAVLGVIELKAGTAKALHIAAGARVSHEVFGGR